MSQSVEPDHADGKPRTRVFTHYVRSVDPRGEPPDTASFDRVWHALRGVLAHELRRRGLWLLPPHYLGLHGWQQWTEAGASGSQSSSSADALGELTADGYVFIFIDRIASLRTHALTKPNIEGLVFLNVRHFVHGLQRRHDPLGARVYLVLQTAVREMVEEGSLEISGGEERVGSGTELVFCTGTATNEATVEVDVELQALVERWSDDLLPTLVTTRGKGHTKLVAQIREHVLGLECQGVPSFALGTLAGLLTRDVRRRWVAILDQAEGEKAIEELEDGNALMVPMVPPDTGFEARRDFRRLVDCTAHELTNLAADERTSDELAALWDVLVDRAAEPKPARAKTSDPPRGREMPSRREMARLLGIHRDRLSRLYEILGGIVSRCREAGRRPTPGATALTVPQADGDRMNPRHLREQLRQATGQAVAQSTQAREEILARSPSGPLPGDVFVLRDSTPTPVEWLVLEAASKTAGQCLVIPADTNPLAGRDDIAVSAAGRGGPLTLRCAFALYLPAELFEPELCSRRLAPIHVEQAREKRQPFRNEIPGLGGASCSDPAYRDWLEDVLAAVRGAIEIGKAREAAPLSFPSQKRRMPWRMVRWPHGLAAAFALVSLGLSAWVWMQQLQLTRRAEPYFEPRSEEIVLRDDPARGPEIWQLSHGAEALLLDLVLGKTPPCEPLRLEFLDAEGSILWASGPFEFPPTEEIRLVLPPRFLALEPVELRFHSRCRGSWQLLESRPLRIDWR